MKRKMPRKFSEQHEQAFQYYLDLGPSRNFLKVAAYMKKSPTTIGNWSIAYGWTDRLKMEIEGKNQEGLISYFSKIASVRNDGILVIETVMAILRESVAIINVARAEDRPLSDEDKAKIARNKDYLMSLGFKVSTGKDLRDFVNALGEIVEFQSGGGGKKVGNQPGLQVTGGSVLILQGLTSEKAKEILQGDNPVPALRGSS